MPKLTKIVGRKVGLEEAQKIVGGYVEMVTLGEYRVLLVNEEGRLQPNELNEEATLLAGMELVGDVLLLEGKEATEGWAWEAEELEEQNLEERK